MTSRTSLNPPPTRQAEEGLHVGEAPPAGRRTHRPAFRLTAPRTGGPSRSRRVLPLAVTTGLLSLGAYACGAAGVVWVLWDGGVATAALAGAFALAAVAAWLDAGLIRCVVDGPVVDPVPPTRGGAGGEPPADGAQAGPGQDGVVWMVVDADPRILGRGRRPMANVYAAFSSLGALLCLVSTGLGLVMMGFDWRLGLVLFGLALLFGLVAQQADSRKRRTLCGWVRDARRAPEDGRDLTPEEQARRAVEAFCRVHEPESAGSPDPGPGTDPGR